MTWLVRPAYMVLSDAFKAETVELREVPGRFLLIDMFYNLGGKMEVKVPTMVMPLGGGASIPLPIENYLIPMDTKSYFCFTFIGTDSGVSIIGNTRNRVFGWSSMVLGQGWGSCLRSGPDPNPYLMDWDQVIYGPDLNNLLVKKFNHGFNPIFH